MKLKTLFTLAVFFLGFIAGACSQSKDQLSPNDFQDKIKEQDIQLVDVRTPAEFEKVRINGAVNVDFNASDFQEKALTLDKTKPVFVYCMSGGRSAKAATFLRKNGYKTYELKGGLLEWNNKKKPVTGAGAPRGMTSPYFNNKVSNEKLVLVDFYAEWCGPCKIMAPDLQALKDQYGDKLELVKVDADTNSFIIDSLKIQALPTLQLYKGGVQVWNHTGLLSKKEIEKTILEEL